MKTLVVKIGSSSLTHPNGSLNFRSMERLCRVLADIAGAGNRVCLVSSGAQAAGFGALGLAEKPRELPGRQACAAVGQVTLMYTYDKLFGEYGKTVGQILLNRADIDNQKHRKNLENTFAALFGYGAIPIVNENDSVVTDEMIIGDNDTLSAVVAGLIGADMLILMSDVDALYTADPRTDPTARRIDVVEDIDSVMAYGGGAGSAVGTGGMATKLAAARYCAERGIEMVLVSGSDPALLYDTVAGAPVGTRFISTKPKG